MVLTRAGKSGRETGEGTSAAAAGTTEAPPPVDLVEVTMVAKPPAELASVERALEEARADNEQLRADKAGLLPRVWGLERRLLKADLARKRAEEALYSCQQHIRNQTDTILCIQRGFEELRRKTAGLKARNSKLEGDLMAAREGWRWSQEG